MNRTKKTKFARSESNPRKRIPYLQSECEKRNESRPSNEEYAFPFRNS